MTMARTKSFKDLVQRQVKDDKKFAVALLREGVDAMLSGDVDTGKTILRDYIKATVGFEKLGEATDTPPKSLIRMCGPCGNPQARISLVFLAICKQGCGCVAGIGSRGHSGHPGPGESLISRKRNPDYKKVSAGEVLGPRCGGAVSGFPVRPQYQVGRSRKHPPSADERHSALLLRCRYTHPPLGYPASAKPVRRRRLHLHRPREGERHRVPFVGAAGAAPAHVLLRFEREPRERVVAIGGAAGVGL